MNQNNGSLSCVGLGMRLGGHLTPLARDFIDNADVCFVLASDALVELWVQKMHPDVRSLQDYYAESKSRKRTYQEMTATVLAEVKLGKKVCAIFYGHPGVFAYVPHKLIRETKALGFKSVMEPGISAEDCLIADLGIDPGKVGCQQYEASQFVFFKRRVDVTAYLILWQIGVVGDLNFGINVTGSAHRAVLLKVLSNFYPLSHKVILYEAATSPFRQVRMDEIALEELPSVLLKDYTTLVIPPSLPLERNLEIIKEIKDITLA